MKPFWWGVILCIVVTAFFLNSLLLNLNKPLSLLHGDAFLVNFILKHWFAALLSGDLSQISTLPMFYGFQNSLFFSDHHFIHAILAFPFFVLTRDVITTSNLYIFFTMLTSIFAMYLLAWHFTKHTLASLLAGIIYVFNPFIMARFPDHLILLSLQWIPLIILFFERSLQKQSSKNTFFFFFFLTCQLLSSLYYSVFLTVILPFYVVLRLWQRKIRVRTLLNVGFFWGLGIFVLTALISGYFYAQVFSQYPINRSLEKTAVTYSARVSDYFFTAPSNLLYGRWKEQAEKAFPSVVRLGIYSEQNLFLGVLVTILFILSFILLRRIKGKIREIWVIGVGLLGLSFLLSFGPEITFSDSLQVPGLYRLFHALNPLFGFLRTAARFGVFVFFFLSLIVAFTLQVLTERLPVRWRSVIGGFVIGLILLEYWTTPLSFTTIPPEAQALYATLNRQQHINVILDYPVGNSIPYPYPQARGEDLDARYLLYATILHNKTLFNGYTGFLPPEYYRRGDYLSVNFPRRRHLLELRQWGVDGIVLHRDEFNQPQEFDRIKMGLEQFGVPLIAQTDSLAVFDLTKWNESR